MSIKSDFLAINVLLSEIQLSYGWNLLFVFGLVFFFFSNLVADKIHDDDAIRNDDATCDLLHKVIQ